MFTYFLTGEDKSHRLRRISVEKSPFSYDSNLFNYDTNRLFTPNCIRTLSTPSLRSIDSGPQTDGISLILNGTVPSLRRDLSGSLESQVWPSMTFIQFQDWIGVICTFDRNDGNIMRKKCEFLLRGILKFNASIVWYDSKVKDRIVSKSTPEKMGVTMAKIYYIPVKEKKMSKRRSRREKKEEEREHKM